MFLQVPGDAGTGWRNTISAVDGKGDRFKKTVLP